MITIPLSQGKMAFIDEVDYESICAYKWFAYKNKNTWYAARNQGDTMISMHRAILNVTQRNIIVDHKDGNGLNNMRINLRICTTGQNLCNRLPHKNKKSKYLGVFWDAERNKWRCAIREKGHLHFVGRFDVESEAATAYNVKAIELHGEFARLNIII